MSDQEPFPRRHRNVVPEPVHVGRPAGWATVKATPAPRPPSGPKLVVDWPSCKAHGLCAELLPEAIRLDEWGYPIIAGPLPDTLLDDANRAVPSCPTLALRLQDPR